MNYFDRIWAIRVSQDMAVFAMSKYLKRPWLFGE
jgi:hypothetical protein